MILYLTTVGVVIVVLVVCKMFWQQPNEPKKHVVADTSTGSVPAVSSVVRSEVHDRTALDTSSGEELSDNTSSTATNNDNEVLGSCSDQDDPPTSIDQLDNDESNMFLSCVDKTALRKTMREHRCLHGLFRFINENFDEWRKGKLNIGIAGCSGAGKSSLINALRDLRANEPGAAAVGIEETTNEAREYMYPNNEKVALWDLPGMGTLNFPQSKYLKTIKFKRFEAIIFVFSTRLLENDIVSAKKLLENSKHVLFVRTKFDIDLANTKREYSDNVDETFMYQDLKDKTKTMLQKAGINPGENLFILSAVDRKKYDFPELDIKLKLILNKKAVAIRNRVFKIVRKEIERKKESFKTSFRLRKGAAILLGILPIRVLDITLNNVSMKAIHKQIQEAFCMDEASLALVRDEIPGISEAAIYRPAIASFEPFVFINRLTMFVFFPDVTFRGFFHTLESVDKISERMAEDELYLAERRLDYFIEQFSVL